MNLDGFALSLASYLYLYTNAQHTARVKEYSFDVWSEHRYEEMVKAGRLADDAHDAEIETCDEIFDKGAWLDLPKEEMAA